MLVQLGLDTLGVDLLDPGVGVDGGRLYPHLPSSQGYAGQAHGLQGHGHERYALLLARGEQDVHIHLPLGGVGVDLLRLGNEIVCSVSLGGEDHNHVVPRQIGLCDDAGYVADALGISHAGAAEFLYDQPHFSFPSCIFFCIKQLHFSKESVFILIFFCPLVQYK